MEIVFVTENILPESVLQEKLQQLGHEVYVSKSLLDNIDDIDCFNFALCIISNTIPKKKVELIIQDLSNKKITVAFKGSDAVNQKISEQEQIKQNDPFLFDTDSIEILNEKIEFFSRQKKTVLSNEINELKLSKNERKVFSLLTSNTSVPFSRERICSYVWNGQVSNSKLSQLSSIVKRINKKIDDTPHVKVKITTLWGEGYSCTRDTE